jgi:transcriptional regulator with XRE-family HTH domain
VSPRQPQNARAVRVDLSVSSESIGERLASLRRQHLLSIRALARQAGVSPSLISEAERGLVEPSIGVLKRLAAVLEVNLTYFFSQPGSSGEAVIRRDERRQLSELHGVTYELLAPDHIRTLEPIFGRLEPGASSGDEPYVHEGEEWGIVLTGRLKVWVGSDIYFLDSGDSIYFPSSVPHRVASASDQTTEYIWVNSPASF